MKLFLKALESTLSNGFFVAKEAVLPTKFPVYKKYSIQVYWIKGEDQTCISNIEASDKVEYRRDIDTLRDKVYTETIENILKYFKL